MTEEQLLEENRRFMRNRQEMRENECANNRRSGMNCRENCLRYGTPYCRHPEKVFNMGG